MAYEESKGAPQPHKLTLDERRRLWVTGVQEVESFDEGEVAVQTVKGLLYVRGQGLKVEKLEKTAGELTISGQVQSLEYSDMEGRGGFWSRLLK